MNYLESFSYQRRKFPDQTSSWIDIGKYNLIRNFIIHNEGQLDNSSQAEKVKSFISNKRSINLNGSDHFQFTKKFCQEFIDTLEKFFSELFNVLPSKKDKK